MVPVLASLVCLCFGQLVEKSSETPCGARLTVSTAESELSAGASARLSLTITNASTNLLRFDENSDATDFQISLIHQKSGKSRALTKPRKTDIFRSITHLIKPGDVYERAIAFDIPKDTEPGDYNLSATCEVLDKDFQRCTLTSNLLKVTIK